MGHGVRLLNIFRIYHGNYIQKDVMCMCASECWHNGGFIRFQSPKGLTDFPFTGFNFNLYTDLNNFTLKSRIVAIVWNTKCAPRFAPIYEHKGFQYMCTNLTQIENSALTHRHKSGN